MPTRDARAVLPRATPVTLKTSTTASKQREKVRASWAALSWREKRGVLRRFRERLAVDAESLIDGFDLPQRADESDSLAAEILPLADACRWLERAVPRVLKTERHRSWLRWLGMPALSIEITRAPLGTILIIGPSNYPLFLPGVQALQAIVAGNAVQIKPGRNGSQVIERFVEILQSAGMPAGLIEVLDEDPAAAEEAIEAGVDKVILTGSLATGEKVLAQLAPQMTPAVMELSGCDPLVVLADADLERVVRALLFSLRLNGGATCIAPRRVLVQRRHYEALQQRLADVVPDLPVVRADEREVARAQQLIDDALACGGRVIAGGSTDLTGNTFAPTVIADACTGLGADIMLPILLLSAFDKATELADLQLAYNLGASVFGSPRAAAQVVPYLPAGCITLNDVIAPTADPRVPFSAAGASGYGTTRGAAGLLEMTRPRVTITRHGRWLPHLDEPRSGTHAVLLAWLQVTNAASWRGKYAALRSLWRAVTPDKKAKYL